MKYLSSYKMFEGMPIPPKPGDGNDVFPTYHALAGMNINRVLENIYASLPQEEVKYFHGQGENTYETYVDVETENGTRRVCIEVSSNAGGLLPVFARIMVDRYQVGMRRIAYRLFKKIKSIYNDLFKN